MKLLIWLLLYVRNRKHILCHFLHLFPRHPTLTLMLETCQFNRGTLIQPPRHKNRTEWGRFRSKVKYIYIYTHTHTHTHTCRELIHFVVQQKLTQHCKAIRLQFKKTGLNVHTYLTLRYCQLIMERMSYKYTCVFINILYLFYTTSHE